MFKCNKGYTYISLQLAHGLIVLSGRPMKQNVYSVTQGDKSYLSFLTQAAGLMADLDLGTEKLRWMGDGRFILGYLQGGKRI